MSVGIKTGYSWYQIGRGDYLESFFSTVAYYLENQQWGSRYPIIMKQLYSGKLSYKDADVAINELKNIRDSLKELSKENNDIIWDARDLTIKVPEWAINLNNEVISLAAYFVTTDGRELIEVFLLALNDSKELKKDLFITSFAKNTTSYF
jgi:hypothetical protein